MTEQSDIWKVKQGGTSRRCLKHGIIVTGCTLFYDCKDCIEARKELKDVSKEPNKCQQKPNLPPHIEDFDVEKRVRIPRTRPIIGQTDGEESEEVPKNTSRRRIRRRTEFTNRKR